MSKIIQKIKTVQKEVGLLQKDKKGYNYKYFDINQLIEKLEPILEKEELVIMQPLTNVGGRPAIETQVYSEDEEYKTTITLPDLDDPQKMGSAVTYYRRYSLVSLFFLRAEDDDGAKAKPKPAAKPVYNQAGVQTKRVDDGVPF